MVVSVAAVRVTSPFISAVFCSLQSLLVSVLASTVTVLPAGMFVKIATFSDASFVCASREKSIPVEEISHLSSETLNLLTSFLR